MPSSRTAADEYLDQHTSCHRHVLSFGNIWQRPSRSDGLTVHGRREALLQAASHDLRTEVRMEEAPNEFSSQAQHLLRRPRGIYGSCLRASSPPKTSTNADLYNMVIQSVAPLYAVPSLEVVHFLENTTFDLSPNLSYRILQIYMQSTAGYSCTLPPMILQLQL